MQHTRSRLLWLTLLTLVMAIASAVPATAQRGRWRPPRARRVERFAREPVRLGVTVGIDVARLHMNDDVFGDETDSRTGPRAGILYSVAIGGSPMRFETGLVYERKGGETASGAGTFAVRDLVDAHYLTLPALFEVPLTPTPTHPFLKVGPELSILLSSNLRRETFDDRGFLIDAVDYDPRFHDLDLGFRLGGGIEFPLGWQAVGALEGSYVFGLPNVSDSDLCLPGSQFCGWPEVHNRAFQLAFSVYGLIE